MTAISTPRLSDDDVADLLELTRGADSVELKVTVPESDQYSALAALGMDPLDAQIRQVFFLDTPDLALNREGVVVRARRVQRKGDDSVIKLRPIEPNEVGAKFRKSPQFVVEVDALPGGYVCSGSMKGTVATGRVRESMGGRLPIRKLFSKEQRGFFAEHAREGIELDDLSVLGPIFVLKLKWKPKGYMRRLVAELWFYPDNSRILELSTKCAPAEAFQAAAETRAFLTNQGIDLSGDQEPKTNKALEFFAAELQD
jgi:hypothetical protein